MNLKDYQRGRNDGLALALKIVQEGGREALEAEIKNRGVTGGELIMNYNESKETVLQLLPAEEVILQFAEECVELSREILVFDVEADGRLLSNGTEYKMLSKVRKRLRMWSWWRMCCWTRYMPRMTGGFWVAWWDPY